MHLRTREKVWRGVARQLNASLRQACKLPAITHACSSMHPKVLCIRLHMTMLQSAGCINNQRNTVRRTIRCSSAAEEEPSALCRRVHQVVRHSQGASC
jgi:hypothetical protein